MGLAAIGKTNGIQNLNNRPVADHQATVTTRTTPAAVAHPTAVRVRTTTERAVVPNRARPKTGTTLPPIPRADTGTTTMTVTAGGGQSRPPAVEPEPLLSAFATGEEGYAAEVIGALDTEEWGGALGDGKERVSLQGMEDERRAFLAQERDSERQQASKEQQEGAGRRDHLYDALWHSESTDELTEEQLELLYAQLAGLRETGISGDELYQAIGQSEVVSGMSEEQRDTLFRDVGAAQSSSSAAQDVEVGSFGTGSEIGPEPGDLLDRGSRRDIGSPLATEFETESPGRILCRTLRTCWIGVPEPGDLRGGTSKGGSILAGLRLRRSWSN